MDANSFFLDPSRRVRTSVPEDGRDRPRPSAESTTSALSTPSTFVSWRCSSRSRSLLRPWKRSSSSRLLTLSHKKFSSHFWVSLGFWKERRVADDLFFV
jgi:hypothetical protein